MQNTSIIRGGLGGMKGLIGDKADVTNEVSGGARDKFERDRLGETPNLLLVV